MKNSFIYLLVFGMFLWSCQQEENVQPDSELSTQSAAVGIPGDDTIDPFDPCDNLGPHVQTCSPGLISCEDALTPANPTFVYWQNLADQNCQLYVVPISCCETLCNTVMHFDFVHFYPKRSWKCKFWLYQQVHSSLHILSGDKGFKSKELSITVFDGESGEKFFDMSSTSVVENEETGEREYVFESLFEKIPSDKGVSIKVNY
ncbi:MAG: hypothetical protein AAFO69_19175 [Bacteroidota bacterium]